MFVIGPAVEVFALAHRHVTGRDRDIRVPTQVVGGVAARRNELQRLLFGRHALSTTFAVIHAVVVTVAEGKTTLGPLGMICHKVDIRRKERLVELMDLHANVGPPKECLDERSAIVKAHLYFNVSLSRMQTDAMHAL